MSAFCKKIYVLILCFLYLKDDADCMPDLMEQATDEDSFFPRGVTEEADYESDKEGL